MKVHLSHLTFQVTSKIETCHDIGLMQINNVLNDNDRILDLFWTNEPDICFSRICDNNILSNETHHKALNIDIEICINQIQINKQFYRDFTNADYTIINNVLNSIDWCDSLSESTSIDSQVEKFYDLVNNVINNHVPLRESKVSNHPCWYDATAIQMKNKVTRLHKNFKRFNSPTIRFEYATLKKSFTKYVRMKYYEYKQNIQQLITEDPTQFYKHVNNT